MEDSGKRLEFASGMVRDTTEGKTKYHLVLDGPMFERWAVHMTKGANKYTDRNWMKANGNEEYDRFKESAFRHFMQWYRGDTDEDHAAATFFNINGAEYVKRQGIIEVLLDKWIPLRHGSGSSESMANTEPWYSKDPSYYKKGESV